MVLATRPKPRSTVHHKKRTGQHQRHSKHFAKTYWPYLPMLGLAIVINACISQQTSFTTAASTAANPTRIEVWTNAGSWIAMVIALIAAGALTIVIGRHARAWQRILTRGEDFLLHNHHQDLLLVGVALIGFIATRSA